MSVAKHLANGKRLCEEGHYDEAIAEYMQVLSIDPNNVEARQAVEFINEETALLETGHARQHVIRTNFLEHQAQEISSPLTKRAPIMVVLAIIGLGLLWGAFQLVVLLLNYENVMAMKDVDVHISKPSEKSGVAFADVTIANFNPAPVRDTALKYVILGTDQTTTIAQGEAKIPTPVPAGDSRTFQGVKLGPVNGQAGRLQAELVSLTYGPKPALAPALSARFVEAAHKSDADAVGDYISIVKAAPEFSPAYVGLGRSLAANKDYDRALDAYKKALKFDPDSINAHYYMGITLVYKKDLAAAKQEFEKARELQSDDPAVLRALSDLGSRSLPNKNARNSDPNQSIATSP